MVASTLSSHQVEVEPGFHHLSIAMPLDSAMIEIIVVRLELAKLVQVGLGQIETVEHS